MSSEQIAELQKTLLNAISKTNANIETLQNTFKTDVENVRVELSVHTNRLNKVESDLKTVCNSDKVDELCLQIEILKQDRLRNNIRITGLPQTAYNDPDEAILCIADVLKADIIPSDYSVYVDRNKSSIIVSFANHTIKRYMLDAMRKKQSLFVEEIYKSAQSNARIYLNDQLSPYFAKLFQSAWQAKKNGSLFSVSSVGGRIRVKKLENSKPLTIETDAQLSNVINSAEHMETEAPHIEQSLRSRTSNSPPAQDQSPASIDSVGARNIREKQFTHQRNHQLTSVIRSQPSGHSQHRPHPPDNTHYQRSSTQQRQPYPKRNNRHVSSLENRSQQPFNKKSKHSTNPNSNETPEYGTREFRDYRRQYQNRLPRLLGGIVGGGMFVIVPAFLSEIANDRVRGILGSTLVLSCNMGILIAFTFGNYFDFYAMPKLVIVLTILFVISLYFCPESPAVLIKQNKLSEAESSIRFYQNMRRNTRDYTLIQAEMEKMKSSIGEAPTEKDDDKNSWNWSDVLTNPGRKAMIIGIVLALLNQFCGCFAMLNYTANIFEEAGSSMSPNMSAIVVGIIQLIGSYMATVLVDRAGRKFLFAVSTIGTALGLITLGVYMMLKSWKYEVDVYNWIPLASFSFAIFISSTAILSLPFLVISEMMPSKLKNFGVSVCMTLLWSSQFIMLKLLPLLNETLGFHGSMFLFATVCLFSALFIILRVPETKGKSYDEIMKALQ